jgi:hypothetical protein
VNTNKKCRHAPCTHPSLTQSFNHPYTYSLSYIHKLTSLYSSTFNYLQRKLDSPHLKRTTTRGRTTSPTFSMCKCMVISSSPLKISLSTTVAAAWRMLKGKLLEHGVTPTTLWEKHAIALTELKIVFVATLKVVVQCTKGMITTGILGCNSTIWVTPLTITPARMLSLGL